MDELLLYCDLLTSQSLSEFSVSIDCCEPLMYNKVRFVIQSYGFIELVLGDTLLWGTHRKVYARFDTLDNLIICKLSMTDE